MHLDAIACLDPDQENQGWCNIKIIFSKLTRSIPQGKAKVKILRINALLDDRIFKIKIILSRFKW